MMSFFVGFAFFELGVLTDKPRSRLNALDVPRSVPK